MFSIKGVIMEYVVITGAYGGMGKKVVETVKNAGYTVFALDKVVEDATDGVIPIQVDLTNEESVKNAFEKVKEITDTVYSIVHFAGIYALDSLVEIDEQKLLKSFDINLFGVYRVNKIFLPLLKAKSRIIITTSELAPLDPLPFTSIYALTKSALDKYAYALRMEVQLLGIDVCVLRPGAVNTGMLNVSITQLDSFCERTEIYKCNAKRFKDIVNKVEARNIPAQKIGLKTLKILKAKHPKHVYKINRNPLLLLLNALPRRMQTAVIKLILKSK